MRSFLGRDILSFKDMEREEYFQIFSVADRLKPFAAERRNGDLLPHKTLLTAFYQPSTRTRLATEAAMHRLGGHVLGFSDAKMTRAGDFYQESIKDTVHMLEYYGDVIAMRHFQQGAPHEAAKWASVPGHQLRRRLGRAPDPGAHRPVHDLEATRAPRRAEVPLRRRHADAHDALDPLRHAPSSTSKASWSARRRCRCSPSSRPSSTSATCQYQEMESVESCIAESGRHLHGARRAGRLHHVARRGHRGQGPHARGLPRHPRAAQGQGQERRHHPALAAEDGRAARRCRRTRHARYWFEAFNGVVMRMALLSLVLGAME